MAIANNGAAIVAQEYVPAAEYKVLIALISLKRPATVPEISEQMGSVMSDASIYSLLNRLFKKRNLVFKETIMVSIMGIDVRRVLWAAHERARIAVLQEPNFNGHLHSIPQLA